MTATPTADGALNPDAAPAPRKSRFVPWFLRFVPWFLLGVVVGLLEFGVGYTVFWLLQQPGDSTRPVQDAASAFFDAVVNGDDAYDQLCAYASGEMTRAQFEENQSVKRLLAYDELVVTEAGGDSAFITVVLTYANGNVETHRVPLAREDGTWKVCGFPY